VTQKTKLIAVNFPHNPTGMTISQQQQDELIDIAASVGAYLVWDAAFDELAPEQPLKNPFLRYPNAISVGTLSKCYGLPGLRVGWCFASEEVQLKSVQLRDYTTLYVSPLIELIAQKAIEYGDVIVGNRIKEVAQNRRHLEDWIEEHAALVEWASPDGGVTSLVKLKTIDNVEQFCKQLAVKCDVMLVPGSCFGHPQYVRLGFGERTEKFVKGLQLVSDFLQKQSIAKAS
jgi:aspartate/methionine/tyrosine aminotransferase